MPTSLSPPPTTVMLSFTASAYISNIRMPAEILTEATPPRATARVSFFWTSKPRILWVQMDSEFGPDELFKSANGQPSQCARIPAQKVMACAFNNEPGSGLLRKYNSPLNITSLCGIDNVNGVSCSRAWGYRTG